MDLHLETLHDISVVELLADTIDTSNADEFRCQLETLSKEHSKLVLDLARVRFLDSSGCGALVHGVKRVQENGGDFRVCCPTHEVKTVLELARLSRVFVMHATREEAIRALSVHSSDSAPNERCSHQK